MSKKNKRFKRTQLLGFESKTIADYEVVLGKLSENKLHKATFITFAILESILMLSSYLYADFSLGQFVFLTVMAVLLARQIALDFAYHIMLEIYTFPIIIASIFAPFYLFNTNTIGQSLIGGFSLFAFFALFTIIISKILKKSAGIGGADIIFAFAIGSFLLPEIVFISIFLFTMLSLIVTFFYSRKEEVPMGPGLLMAFWLCLLFQNQIINYIAVY